MKKARDAAGGRNQIGQVMGRKGHDTRARLITAAAQLVATKPLRDLRVSDIARAAGIGAPSFYVYFPDVGAAVLAALEGHPQSSPELLEILDRDWSADGSACARAFVDAYLDSWQHNFALLRARNLAADEGDARFVEQRRGDIQPILDRLAAKVRAAQQAGHAPGDVAPAAVAGAISAALERLAAAPRWSRTGPELEAELRQAVAYILVSALALPA